MKIEELNISSREKQLLMELREPKTIAQIAAIIRTSYNYTSTLLMVLYAGNFIKKMKRGRQTLYFLNQDEVKI